MKSKQLHLFVVILLHLATSEATTRGHSLCSNAKAFTLMPDERHCGQFYVCTGRKDHSYQEFKCAKDYHFSSHRQRCVMGACAEVAAPSCNATGSNSVQRLLDDCTSFKRCSSRGDLAVLSCSYGHYFDAERNACLPVAVTPGHQCSCLLPEHAMLANLEDCRSFYRCEQGKAVLQQCPQDYYYDASVNSCLLDTSGVCLEPEIGEWLPECDREGSRLLPHASNCSLFFVCMGSRAIELTCPNGQYFDAVSRYCTSDVGVQCHKPTSETRVTTTAAPVKAQEVISHKQAQDVIKHAPEVASHKPTPEVISNKLYSKFLLV